MASTKVRTASAAAKVRDMIDEAAKLDQSVTNDRYRLDGLKCEITKQVIGKLEGGEKSLRVAGNVAAATLTVSKSLSVEVSDDLRKKIEKGKLDGLLSLGISVEVSPSKLAAVVSALEAMGLKPEVAASLTREAKKAPEKAREALGSALQEKQSEKMSFDFDGPGNMEG